jgi:DNA (cytosine-5)-methyltransferase 1
MKTAIFSFFSGIGFLDLGFENAGYDIVYVNEVHEPFLSGYKHSRKVLNKPEPQHGYYLGDVRNYLNSDGKKLSEKIKAAKKNYDLIGFIGGPPCPDFSIGGKNKGRKGENGVLSEVYINLICEMKPDFFLFENVKGLWSTQKHRQFYEELKTKLHNEGYFTSDKLTNCIEYGVPQDRWRMFLFGVRNLFNNIPRSDKINGLLSNFDWEVKTIFSPKKAFGFPWPQTSPFDLNSELPQPKSIPTELTTQAWFQKNLTNDHPNTEHCFTPKAALKKFLSIDEGDDSRKSFKRIHRWRYSPTACYGNNEVHLHPYQARRLNVAETLAIQSLPQSYELPPNMSLTDMFKAIGNGVPYLAAKGVAETIKEYFEWEKF